MPSFVQKRSYGSVRVFWLDRVGLVEALEGKAREAIERFPEVLQVILFGSLARGDATPRSDADLIFVVREAGPFLQRSGKYLPLFEDLDFPIDLLVYTEDELERVALAKRALREGRVLASR